VVRRVDVDAEVRLDDQPVDFDGVTRLGRAQVDDGVGVFGIVAEQTIAEALDQRRAEDPR
jgi:hypothetical protein